MEKILDQLKELAFAVIAQAAREEKYELVSKGAMVLQCVEEGKEQLAIAAGAEMMEALRLANREG